MKPRHSDSLLLIWRLAEFEARQLKSAIIEPTHLLLGLCKSVDLDLSAIVSKASPDHDEVLEELLREVRRLRTIFRATGLDARIFRRALRRVSGGNRTAQSESQRLRRSKSAKLVFSDAEHFAEMSNCMVFPVHLLYAVVLVEDHSRDTVLKDCGVELKRLEQVAKRELTFLPRAETPSAAFN